MALIFPVHAPELQEAIALDNAFVTLSNYYSQSNGKQAAAIRAIINSVFVFDAGNDRRPNVLWHYGTDPELLQVTALRRAYYLTILRPVLADATFLGQLHKVTLRVKDMHYPTEQRDAAVKVLEDGLIYWDAIYKQ